METLKLIVKFEDTEKVHNSVTPLNLGDQIRIRMNSGASYHTSVESMEGDTAIARVLGTNLKRNIILAIDVRKKKEDLVH
jgi:hypothetical protein